MTVLDAAAAERGKLRRVLGRMDTVFFLISAMVVVDTIGAIAVGGGETFTWLVVLFVTFFIPSALASAELGAALPEEGGAYVWVRRAFGRYAGALTSLLSLGRCHRRAGLGSSHRGRPRPALPVPAISALITDPSWRQRLQQLGPTIAGLAIQATRYPGRLPIGPWAGLGVLASWPLPRCLPAGCCSGGVTPE